jgi:protein-S-isoprenylcysteine O-methyltransferase Ste14
MRARIGYFVGVLLAAIGIGLALGLGWGLLAAGVGLIAYTVLLYDVDEPEQAEPEGVRFR